MQGKHWHFKGKSTLKDFQRYQIGKLATILCCILIVKINQIQFSFIKKVMHRKQKCIKKSFKKEI